MPVQSAAVRNIKGVLFSGKHNSAIAPRGIVQPALQIIFAIIIQNRISFKHTALFCIVYGDPAVSQTQQLSTSKRHHFRLLRQRKQQIYLPVFPINGTDFSGYCRAETLRFRFGKHLINVITILQLSQNFPFVSCRIHADYVIDQFLVFE